MKKFAKAYYSKDDMKRHGVTISKGRDGLWVAVITLKRTGEFLDSFKHEDVAKVADWVACDMVELEAFEALNHWAKRA